MQGPEARTQGVFARVLSFIFWYGTVPYQVKKAGVMSAESVEVLDAHRSAKGVQRTQGLTVAAVQPFLKRDFPGHLGERSYRPSCRVLAHHLAAASRRDGPVCGWCNKAQRNPNE